MSTLDRVTAIVVEAINEKVGDRLRFIGSPPNVHLTDGCYAATVNAEQDWDAHAVCDEINDRLADEDIYHFEVEALSGYEVGILDHTETIMRGALGSGS